MLGSGLNTGLRWVREQSTGDTQQDLGADDARVAGPFGTTAVADEQAKGYHEENGTHDDERFQTADLQHHET